MCFAPQRRALFRHRKFQKRSDAEVFCTFWLGNVLRATTACTFLTSQLSKVVRDRQFLTLLTSKCASHHNGVQFFIAPVASWLRTRRFSEPTFRPSGATNHWKNTVFRDFPTFSRICIFCLLTLSLLIFSLLIFLFSLPLPCSAFHLSILSEVWLLNFLRLIHSRGSRFTLGVLGLRLKVYSLDVSQPFATIRKYPRGPYGRALEECFKNGHFWKFQMPCRLVSRGKRTQTRRFLSFQYISKLVENGLWHVQFTSFSEDELHFSWQAHRFGNLHYHCMVGASFWKPSSSLCMASAAFQTYCAAYFLRIA